MKHPFRPLVPAALAAVSLLPAPAAVAQESPPPGAAEEAAPEAPAATIAEEIVVSASHLAVERERVGSAVTVIDRAEIERVGSAVTVTAPRRSI
ncbi:MAG TPA: hypothetical protein VHM02_05400, partial [Thermoanaerobaculia bacterium]|nr:hypothetical protein [Thermoanaerobaculia bacterium]